MPCAVTVGTSIGSRPLETTTDTAVARLTDAFEGGSWETTTPAGTVSLQACDCSPSRSVSGESADPRSPALSPTRLGTAYRSWPLDTTRRTVERLPSSLPAVGSTRSTTPLALTSENSPVVSTEREACRIAPSACEICWPTTAGTTVEPPGPAVNHQPPNAAPATMRAAAIHSGKRPSSAVAVVAVDRHGCGVLEEWAVVIVVDGQTSKCGTTELGGVRAVGLRASIGRAGAG